MQLFGPLLTKLSKLEFLHDTFRYGEIPDDSLLVSELLKDVFNYPSIDVIKLIESCQTKIDEIRERGESIVSLISVEEYDFDVKEYLPVNEQKKIETKKELYSTIVTELNIFELELLLIKELLINNQNIGINSDSSIGGLELDSQQKLPKPIQSPKITSLDRYQTALLFHYLKEENLILPYSDVALGKLVGLLSGHSSNTLSKNGFGAINYVKSDHPEAVNKVESKGIKNYNLNKVKTKLQAIIREIEEEITRQNRLSRK